MIPVTTIRQSLILAFLFLAFTCSGADNANRRTFPETEYFVNNRKFGDTNGCSGDLGKTGSCSCGHPGHVSKLTWTFLHSSTEGDVYRISREYPADSKTPNTETKEVTFSGKVLMLWQDDYQKIVLRPKSRTQDQSGKR